MTRRSFLAVLAGLAGLGGWWLRDLFAQPDPPSEAAPAVPAPGPEPEAPVPVPTTSSVPQGVTMEVISRGGWGALAAGDGGVSHEITNMTYHHTAGSNSENSVVPERFRQYQLQHQERGWIDVAYHFLIDRNGNVYEGRSLEIAGDTGTDYNPAGHFLPVMEGEFTLSAPSEAQLNSLASLVAWGSDTFGVPTSALGAHRDYAATSCPGDMAYALIGDIAARAALLIRQGGVTLSRLSDAESKRRVAAIEA